MRKLIFSLEDITKNGTGTKIAVSLKPQCWRDYPPQSRSSARSTTESRSLGLMSMKRSLLGSLAMALISARLWSALTTTASMVMPSLLANWASGSVREALTVEWPSLTNRPILGTFGRSPALPNNLVRVSRRAACNRNRPYVLVIFIHHRLVAKLRNTRNDTENSP